MDSKKIRSLLCSGNQITDEGLIHIFDSLELNHHFELEELELRENNLTSKSIDILLSACDRFQSLQKIHLEDNKG